MSVHMLHPEKPRVKLHQCPYCGQFGPHACNGTTREYKSKVFLGKDLYQRLAAEYQLPEDIPMIVINNVAYIPSTYLSGNEFVSADPKLLNVIVGGTCA